MKNEPKAVGMFNTWYEDIPGFVTEMKDGHLSKKPAIIEVQFTSDEHETLSLAYDERQFTINFANLNEIIRIARKHNEQRKDS